MRLTSDRSQELALIVRTRQAGSLHEARRPHARLAAGLRFLQNPQLLKRCEPASLRQWHDLRIWQLCTLIYVARHLSLTSAHPNAP